MKRLYTIDEFAKLPEQQRDGSISISTTSLFEPEFGDSGRLITYTFSTPAVGRDAHTVAADAWQLDNYERNPVFLWFHDDSLPPIGRVIDIGTVDAKLKGTVEYADRDLNPFADMIYRMVKARYINAVSTSWQPLAWNFSRDKARPGGVDFTKVDMLEISQVPVPALPAALAEARANGIDTAPMVEWAEKLLDTGGMILVPRTELETLRRASNMSKPTKPTKAADPAPTSDPAPIVEVDPAASSSSDLARRALKTKHDRTIARAPKIPVFKRGLYDVAQMAQVLSMMGYLHDSSEYEADIEGDDSPVPGMILESLETFVAAFKAAATEEADELLAAHSDDDDMEDETRSLPAETRAFIAAGETPRVRAWRAGIAVARAGKAISKSNVEKLQEAEDHHDRAMKHHKALGDHQEAVGDHIEAAQDHHAAATKAVAAVGEHLRAIQDPASPEDGAENLDKAVKFHRAATSSLEKVGTEHTNMADRNEDVGDSQRALGRCVKSAQRCVRSVVDGADTTEPDSKGSDDVEDEQKAKEEKARRLRLAKAHQLRGSAAA
jgi:hypothetical protein